MGNKSSINIDCATLQGVNIDPEMWGEEEIRQIHKTFIEKEENFLITAEQLCSYLHEAFHKKTDSLSIHQEEVEDALLLNNRFCNKVSQNIMNTFSGRSLSPSPLPSNSNIEDYADKEAKSRDGREEIPHDNNNIRADMMVVLCGLAIQSKSIGIEDTVRLIFLFHDFNGEGKLSYFNLDLAMLSSLRAMTRIRMWREEKKIMEIRIQHHRLRNNVERDREEEESGNFLYYDGEDMKERDHVEETKEKSDILKITLPKQQERDEMIKSMYKVASKDTIFHEINENEFVEWVKMKLKCYHSVDFIAIDTAMHRLGCRDYSTEN